MQANPDDVRWATEHLIRKGFPNPEIDPAVQVGEPLPVMHPNGIQHSWFVPLEAGGKLLGFAQLLTSLVPMRVSWFQRSPRDYEYCPDIADWTDIHRIAARAASVARQGEQLSAPLLTYDGNPDRVAWMVEAKSTSGETRRLFVAGTAVYEKSKSEGVI
jgi:hypothetical protein